MHYHKEGTSVPSLFYFWRSTMKNALSILALLLLIAGTTYSADKRVDVPIGDSPSMGPENSPITIIEFIDFQ
jgi:hypothetical protein